MEGDFWYNVRMTDFTLDSQLEKDTHQLLSCDDFYVLLQRNKTLPWFIIVPKYEAIEWFELSVEIQEKTTKLSRKLGLFLKQYHGCDKVNTASIGNVVSQLHIHVIGRFHDDPLWPDVVWGNELPILNYVESELDQWASDLQGALKIL